MSSQKYSATAIAIYCTTHRVSSLPGEDSDPKKQIHAKSRANNNFDTLNDPRNEESDAALIKSRQSDHVST